MDLIREIELEGGGTIEVQASASGQLVQPVSVRIHSPATHHPYMTAGEAIEFAIGLIMAADRAEGRPLADASGPVAIIDALARELYHGDRQPSLLHRHTAAAIDAILGA